MGLRAARGAVPGARRQSAGRIACNPHASIEDVKAVAISVLRHRIGLNFNAHADNVDTVKIAQMLLDTVPVQ